MGSPWRSNMKLVPPADLPDQGRAARNAAISQDLAPRQPFPLVDDVEFDARAAPDPVEEDFPGLAHRAGRRGVDPGDTVRVHRLPEALERADHRVNRLRTDGASRERVPAAPLYSPRRCQGLTEVTSRSPGVSRWRPCRHRDQPRLPPVPARRRRAESSGVGRHRNIMPEPVLRRRQAAEQAAPADPLFWADVANAL
jgi:hypothetical protein